MGSGLKKKIKNIIKLKRLKKIQYLVFNNVGFMLGTHVFDRKKTTIHLYSQVQKLKGRRIRKSKDQISVAL